MVTNRNKRFSIGRESQPDCPSILSVETAYFLATRNIEEDDMAFTIGDGQALAVGSKRHSLHSSCVPDNADALAAGHIPEADGLVLAATDHQLSIRRHCHPIDTVGVLSQLHLGLGRFRWF